MGDDFLAQFLGSVPRARILRVFIFSPIEVFTAAHVAKRAHVPARAVAKEIKELEKLGILKEGKIAITLANKTKRSVKGKQKEHAWMFNQNFKYAHALSAFVHEIVPMQHKRIVDSLKGSGKLVAVILSGSFVSDETRPADIIVVADPLYEKRLEHAIKALEPKLGREIRYAAFSTPEFRYRLTIQDRLIRDTMDYPHIVLMDKARLL